MKAYRRSISVLSLMLMMVLLVSCGYRNPYVYSGPEKVINIRDWKNRTNELGLNSNIYKTLVRWYQKSGSIRITKDKEGADMVLAGEIISIDRPSLSYGSGNTTTEVKIKLKVRYILKDLASGKTLIEEGSEEWSKEYLVGASASETSDNQNEAIEEIIDELCQKIYQKTLVEIPKLQM